MKIFLKNRHDETGWLGIVDRAWTAAYVFFTAYALFSIDIDALVGDKLLRQLNF